MPINVSTEHVDSTMHRMYWWGTLLTRFRRHSLRVVHGCVLNVGDMKRCRVDPSGSPRGGHGVTCFVCGRAGHLAKNCTVCARCGVDGHWAKDCTLHRRARASTNPQVQLLPGLPARPPAAALRELSACLTEIALQCTRAKNILNQIGAPL